MGSLGGDESIQLGAKGSNAHEERILVSVRLRPLNENEIARNDVPEWECINNTTVIFKNNLQEKSMLPAAYTFDRVFGCDSSTKNVYEEGAKEVALSVVSGINSSIFAYGQTSSGKTYTMRGITECTIADIYDYIQRNGHREYKLKFSAMEIYNESVRDLLSMDSTPLRLLDDPERGTIVEKLTEETLRDWSHLKELLSICEAQRQIGETSLNEMSSRSHQILRLTIDSSAREFLGSGNSSILTAAVNFVDLAGSERASQTLSAGTRLKEGCHINRSLLTLGTVIRKLSKGRNAHIPYRDSKLTRILQNSLGGNARTAIICTMSPAHSHVEQSRNTLLFASCAKEVSTNARVNVVMSEKALVKQLQRQLVKLEAELRSLGSTSATCNSADLIKQKELLIEKMDLEIRELTEQRDLAQSRIQDLLKSAGEYQGSTTWNGHHLEQNAWLYDYSASESSELVDSLRSDVASCTSRISDRGDGPNYYKHHLQLPENSEDQFLLDNNSPRVIINKVFGPDSCNGWGWESTGLKAFENSEDLCKEVQCIELAETNIDRSIRSEAISYAKEGDTDSTHMYSDLSCEALKQKIQDMQKTIDRLASPFPVEQSPYSSDADMSGSRSVNLSRSRSCKASLTTISMPAWFEKEEQNKNILQSRSDKEFPGRPEGGKLNLSESDVGAYPDMLCGNDSEISNMVKEEKSTKVSGEGDYSFDSGLNEVLQSKSQKKIADALIQEDKPRISDPVIIVKDVDFDKVQDFQQSPSNWPMEFERQQREIIELWEECNVPLVHRTYFFLLFKGDPSDSVYMEVELRRLSFLKHSLFSGSKTTKDGQVLTLASSKKALNRERETLGRQILKRFSTKEREVLYQKWGINLKTKRRRLQLSRQLWTDTKDMNHIKESAAVVSRLVGFAEADQTPKEMFGLSFSLPSMKVRSSSWKTRRSFL